MLGRDGLSNAEKGGAYIKFFLAFEFLVELSPKLICRAMTKKLAQAGRLVEAMEN